MNTVLRYAAWAWGWAMTVLLPGCARSGTDPGIQPNVSPMLYVPAVFGAAAIGAVVGYAIARKRRGSRKGDQGKNDRSKH